MDKLKMHTPDLADDNFRKLAAMFPNAVTEVIVGYDENGKAIIERAIDADVLRQEISAQVVEGRQERYQFNWPDKKKSIVLANSPIAETLRLDRAKSVGRDGSLGSIDTENIYIEGDNLLALKLLRETYFGKVKMIYIDPPYNTGKDSFVYDDDYHMALDEFTESSNVYDENDNMLYDIKQNNESNGRFHTDWLNMIYPRLRLAKDLLTDDGVIFISIDDNEQENLKKVCDEIFGLRNYIGTYVKQSKVGGGSDSRHIVKEHEYCLVYGKNINNTLEMFIVHESDYLKRYKEEDEKGKFFWDTFARPGLKNPIFYDIVAPDGTIMNYGWIHSKDRFDKELKDGTVRIIPKKNGGWSVQFKQYLNLNGRKPRSLTMDFGGNIEGKNDISSLFDFSNVFKYPKSVKFIKTLLSTMKNNDDIILDFFSGSATTAQAVMQLNAEDNGCRKFIMIQIPDKVKETEEAYKLGYKNICEIGEERIRRAGQKIKAETGANIDYGFRVFRVDSGNMKDVYYRPSEYKQEQLELFADNIKPDRTPEDLLFQVMLDLGIALFSRIEEIEIAGKKVFAVDDNYLLACFDSNISEETVTAIAKQQPRYAVFRDSSMVSDSVAINFEQIFKTYSPKTERRVL